MHPARSGDRNVVGGDRHIPDRGIGYLRRGDRYTLDRWLGSQGGGGVTPPPIGHDGDPVLLWPNQAPPIAAQRPRAGLINVVNLTASGSTAPIFKERIINNLPVVRLSAAAGSIMDVTGGTNDFPADLPWTIMAIMRNTPGNALFTLNGSPSSSWGPVLTAGPPKALYAWDQAYYFWIPGAGDLPQNGDGNFHLFTAQSGTTYELAVDGTPLTHSFNSGPNAVNFAHFGGGGSDGDVAALLYYRADLADTDRANLRAYFANKYALPIANLGTPVSPDTVAMLYGWFEADTIFT